MLKHVILFKLKEENKEKNSKELVKQLIGLKDTIGQIKEMQAGVNVSTSGNAYDVGMYSVFANNEDLQAYRVRPEHQEVLEYIKQVVEEMHVVDYLD